MAKFNEILEGRYNRAFQKLLSMKGPPALVTLADEAIGIFPFFWGAEMRYLEGWERFGSNPSISTAATVPGFRLRNPAASGVVAVVEKIVYFASVADNGIVLQGGAATTDLTTPFGSVAFDGRTVRQPSLIPSAQVTPTNLAATAFRYGVAANLAVDILVTDIHELPILPGFALQIIGGSSTANLACSFLWRERVLGDAEKT